MVKKCVWVVWLKIVHILLLVLILYCLLTINPFLKHFLILARGFYATQFAFDLFTRLKCALTYLRNKMKEN